MKNLNEFTYNFYLLFYLLCNNIHSHIYCTASNLLIKSHKRKLPMIYDSSSSIVNILSSDFLRPNLIVCEYWMYKEHIEVRYFFVL